MTIKYSMLRCNEDISLYVGPINLQSNGLQQDFDATMMLKWLPSADIRFHVDRASFGSMRLHFADDVQLSTPDSIRSCPVFVSNFFTGSNQPTSFSGLLNGELTLGSSDEAIDSIQLSLVNFPKFSSSIKGAMSPRTEALSFSFDDWRIEIEPVVNLDDLLKELKQEGGFAITHLAQIRRSDGSQFKDENAKTLLDGLYLVLSFIAGRWVNAILPHGMIGEDEVWRKLAPWRVKPWQSSDNWADPHHGQFFEPVVQGFFKLFSDSAWNFSLRNVLHDYIHSNTNAADLESSIVLTQTALDTIAWELLVQQDGELTEDRFKQLSYSDRLRKLLTTQSIPVEFVDEFPGLRHLSSQHQHWRDLAGAVADIRNRIIHPQMSDRQVILHGSNVVFEAWQCGLWMLELSLLQLFGMNESYSDRRQSNRFVGIVADVPWR